MKNNNTVLILLSVIIAVLIFYFTLGAINVDTALNQAKPIKQLF